MQKRKGAGALKLFCSVVLMAFVIFTAAMGYGADQASSIYDVKLGLDLAGGVSITYQAAGDTNPTPTEISDTIEKLRKRVEFSRAERFTLYLDGRPIAATRPADSLPVEFRPLYAETEPMDLTPGEHVLKLVTGEDDCNYFLPAAFVAGRFAVQGNALVSLPEKLTTAPVAAQGLSNYCGQVTYALDGVTRPEGATALRLDVGNAFARVKWNGVDLGGRGWAPYEWKLPADAAKTGRLEVTVFTSVWNIFGERERPDAKWDTHFWNAQHDAESNPSLKSAVWIR